jgi:teichuronic acid biosynthesis glycosyltransferase TuaC
MNSEQRFSVMFLVMGYPSDVLPVAGIFHKTLAEQLQKLGVRIVVFAPVPIVPPGFRRLSPKWKTYTEIPDHYTLNGVEVYSPRYFQIPHGDFWSAPHFFIQKAMEFGVVRPPDLIHVHFAYPSGLAAIGLAKTWHVPTVLTLHGSDVNTNPHVNMLALKRFQRAVRSASYVTAVSQALAERTFALSQRMPEVIPIGINLHNYSCLPDKSEARRKLGLPMTGTLALFVGTLIPQKGVREFTAALEDPKMADVTGVMVGDGPLRHELAQSKRVMCMGMQDNTKIPLFMKACDVLVLPSYAEGMPTVLVEAGAVGLPIVSSRVGGICELLNEERGTLLETILPSAIASAIRRTLDDASGSHARSEQLKEFIQMRYGVEKNACLFFSRYKECIDSYHRVNKEKV